MSYTVLARKWRPNSFKELVGQEHVQRAIVNAIDQNRLHHAYLFTGTRGVGKTTIARIFAKCLNCEEGITSTPCGSCSSCQAIEQGHYVDLMEIDAASRTKVEDTRELLDNVQYRPTRGRYKVYLIDEVHMLSNSSFNALLKTLEEPPPHVVFLLATTDPQKLPITVLSRCLQFHLKRMSPQSIEQHISFVLSQENIPFDQPSVELISRAADGSMRDALSLLDQAIAFGAGKLEQKDVADMLGSVDQQFVSELLCALASDNAVELMAVVERMSEFSPDYASVLAEVLSVLHQLALAQFIDGANIKLARMNELVEQLSAEDIQLFYQMGIQSRNDLALAPDQRQGFEMALLRMLAFRPMQAGLVTPRERQSRPSESISARDKTQAPSIKQSELTQKKKSLTPSQDRLNSSRQTNLSQPVQRSEGGLTSDLAVETVSQIQLESSDEHHVSSEESGKNQHNPVEARQSKNIDVKAGLLTGTAQENDQPWCSTETKTQEINRTADIMSPGVNENSQHSEMAELEFNPEMLLQPDNWYHWIPTLELTGTLFQVLNNSVLSSISQSQLVLNIIPSVEHFCTDAALQKISESISQKLNRPLKIVVELTQEHVLTPRMISEQKLQQKRQAVLKSFQDNPKLRSILDTFSAQIGLEDIELGQ